jgi:hypothetical protein
MTKQNGLIAAAVALTLSAPVYAAEVTVSGVVEVEASSVENYDGETSTDVVLATAAMAVDAKLNERVSATLALLYEEDDVAFDGATLGLDEGYVTVQMNNTTALVAGHLYVPFGSFESNMVSDPMTLVLGETSETAIMLDMASGNVFGSLYTFNGDAKETTTSPDNDTLSFGANAGFANDDFSIGASYISNIADSNTLQDPGFSNTLDSAVPGMGVNLAWNINNFSVIGEYLAATQSFENGDVLGAADGTAVTVANAEKPTASYVELAYNTGVATIAVAYQMTEEALFLGLPETATSIAVSFDLMEGAGVGIEYISNEDYSVADGGTGETETAFTVQLAVEF